MLGIGLGWSVRKLFLRNGVLWEREIWVFIMRGDRVLRKDGEGVVVVGLVEKYFVVIYRG